MITNKQIGSAKKFAVDVLGQNCSNQQVQSVVYQMENAYEEIRPHVPKLKSSFNRALIKISIDTLAFYRALLTEFSRDEAIEMIQPYVNRWMDGQFDSWIARKVYGNRFLHRLYRRWWFAQTNKADDIDGQKFEYIGPSGELFYGVNVVRCGHVNFLKKMNAPELAPYMCRADFYIQKYLPSGIRFKRSQVISEGAPFCDFRYIIEDQEIPVKRK